MDKKPTISVIIPTYNRLFSLGELLEALSRQTFSDFEVIIVNDAGVSISVLKHLYDELNITIINLPENKNHVYARNVGIEKALGTYIMLIDDDDIILPSHMEKMLSQMQDYDLVYSDVEIINYEVKGNVRYVKSRRLFAYQYDLKAMRTFSTFVPSGCLYKKAIHQTTGNFDLEVKNYWDWDFFLRVANTYRIQRSPYASVLYEFSDTGNNASKNLQAMRTYLNRLSEKHALGELPTKNFFLLLEELEMKKREAASHLLWDGQPIVSRLIEKNIN
ncbi:glycosyltransferase family 2 protein [Evansella cellulosilytica]|uniref:Glycosyl transferase family 2 n=1 Tax=Evansella cellulosilytica (strain ATCC 21833 / DSM 2522 / FERM P-1141 / JCM 9156 / N-4) TaxID=649639 RepID=E6U1C6_EVAC2|nr:glycosyltransferase family 2 protein [Evansella cellulosilytica]ADU29173.1 glycosyl transferase family 2 [Evansella cellulosilytica DSM 2522]